MKKKRSTGAIRKRRAAENKMRKLKKRFKKDDERKAKAQELELVKSEAAMYRAKYDKVKREWSKHFQKTTVPSIRCGLATNSKSVVRHANFLTSRMPGCNILSSKVVNFPPEELILGEGVFGKVVVARLETINIDVAVKIQKTHHFSAFDEARILQCLAGSAMFPFVFGTVGNSLVMQLIGKKHEKFGFVTYTVSNQLSLFHKKHVQILSEREENVYLTMGKKDWLQLCLMIIDAVKFMHEKNILHNDIKGDNILISPQSANIIPKLCDFGKATHKACPKVYNLTPEERIRYNAKHRHLAYELRSIPNSAQTELSDIYSVGYLFKTIAYYLKLKCLIPIAHGMKAQDKKLRWTLLQTHLELKNAIESSCV